MFDQAEHYEWLDELLPRFYPDTGDETGEDELMDAERRAEEDERIRDSLREDGCPV